MSEMLPSGLPRIVADDEDLARFVFASDHVRKSDLSVKPAAFLPSQKDRATSVSRHGPEPRDALWTLAPEREGRTLHGVAIVKAKAVRQNHLELDADDKPARHANIVGWPTQGPDDLLLKAQCKDLANGIAQTATFIPLVPSS